MEPDTACIKDKAPAPVGNADPSTPDVKNDDLATAGNGEEIISQLSKNKLKKLKRDQEWEANREKRKAKRKDKNEERKERKRAAKEVLGPDAPKKVKFTEANGKAFIGSKERARSKHLQHAQLPITLVLDCGFDDLMKNTELKSLSSQVTRSYSDCYRAPFQAHLAISSFGGRLKERFEGLLASNHKSWKNVKFLEEDFVEASKQAKIWMSGQEGGKMAAVFEKYAEEEGNSESNLKEAAEVVYLTSDSEHTLTDLKPYSTYVIGGIVDKNRHKGVCYKKALDRGIQTAKLPIGDYMQMQSRFVLTTNHVVEIMLRWLECGDWGEAFLKVIPKRKCGSLKAGSEGSDASSTAPISVNNQSDTVTAITDAEGQEVVDENEDDEGDGGNGSQDGGPDLPEATVEPSQPDVHADPGFTNVVVDPGPVDLASECSHHRDTLVNAASSGSNLLDDTIETKPQD